MSAYDEALAAADKVIQEYDLLPHDTDELLIHKVAALYEPGVTKAKDIAGSLGKSVRQIERIISQVVAAEKA